MSIKQIIVSIFFCLQVLPCFSQAKDNYQFDFFGDTIQLPKEPSFDVAFNEPLSKENISTFYEKLEASQYAPVLKSLMDYKEQQKPDDWLYYQLIRKTAQLVSPKAENYHRYTLYKWFLLAKSGYDARITITADKILFYVQSDENIYDIPYRMKYGKQYVCLNYHDYNVIDFSKEQFNEVAIRFPEAQKAFSYKLTKMPKFAPTDYVEKDLNFRYNESQYHFKVKLNPQLKNIFANYPVVDYANYFNTPLSNETYQSLIPLLKKQVKGLNVKNGVDYLMRFTRHAFLFKTDTETFGREKRLLPEQTLLFESSDCEDRAALFFYLVKEIYNLPMIVLSYPKHVTIAIKFDKPVGESIVYNGSKYSVCESTPQKEDLAIGNGLPELKHTSYEVVYTYDPLMNK